MQSSRIRQPRSAGPLATECDTIRSRTAGTQVLEVQVRAVGWQHVAAQRNGAVGRVAGAWQARLPRCGDTGRRERRRRKVYGLVGKMLSGEES